MDIITNSNLSPWTIEQHSLSSTLPKEEGIDLGSRENLDALSKFFKVKDIALQILDLLSSEDVKSLLRVNRSMWCRLVEIVSKQKDRFQCYTPLFAKAMGKDEKVYFAVPLRVSSVTFGFPSLFGRALGMIYGDPNDSISSLPQMFSMKDSLIQSLYYALVSTPGLSDMVKNSRDPVLQALQVIVELQSVCPKEVSVACARLGWVQETKNLPSLFPDDSGDIRKDEVLRALVQARAEQGDFASAMRVADGMYRESEKVHVWLLLASLLARVDVEAAKKLLVRVRDRVKDEQACSVSRAIFSSIIIAQSELGDLDSAQETISLLDQEYIGSVLERVISRMIFGGSLEDAEAILLRASHIEKHTKFSLLKDIFDIYLRENNILAAKETFDKVQECLCEIDDPLYKNRARVIIACMHSLFSDIEQAKNTVCEISGNYEAVKNTISQLLELGEQQKSRGDHKGFQETMYRIENSLIPTIGGDINRLDINRLWADIAISQSKIGVSAEQTIEKIPEGKRAQVLLEAIFCRRVEKDAQREQGIIDLLKKMFSAYSHEDPVRDVILKNIAFTQAVVRDRAGLEETIAEFSDKETADRFLLNEIIPVFLQQLEFDEIGRDLLRYAKDVLMRIDEKRNETHGVSLFLWKYLSLRLGDFGEFKSAREVAEKLKMKSRSIYAETLINFADKEKESQLPVENQKTIRDNFQKTLADAKSVILSLKEEESDELWYELALVFLRRGSFNAAAEMIDNIVDKETKSLALVDMANEKVAQSQFKEAQRLLASAYNIVCLLNDSDDLLVSMSSLYIHMRDFANAVKRSSQIRSNHVRSRVVGRILAAAVRVINEKRSVCSWFGQV